MSFFSLCFEINQFLNNKKHSYGELGLFRSLMFSFPSLRAHQETFSTVVRLNMPFWNEHNFCFILTQTPTDSSNIFDIKNLRFEWKRAFIEMAEHRIILTSGGFSFCSVCGDCRAYVIS